MEKPNQIVRVAKVTAGFVLLPVGVALLVTPGPGLPVLAASLVLLEDEFSWAARVRVEITDFGRRGVTWLRQKAPQPFLGRRL